MMIPFRIADRANRIAAAFGAGLLATAVLLPITPATAAGASSDPEPHSNSVGNAISDTAVTAKVKAELLDDKEMKGTDVSVETNNGAVMLSGQVRSSKQKDHAERVVKQIDGVKTVDVSNLIVVSK